MIGLGSDKNHPVSLHVEMTNKHQSPYFSTNDKQYSRKHSLCATIIVHIASRIFYTQLVFWLKKDTCLDCEEKDCAHCTGFILSA